MSSYTLYGRAVIKGELIENAAVAVSNGIITACGERSTVEAVGEITELGDALIMPGFIDIHCHAGGEIWAYENPLACAEYQLSHGTTAMCCTLYRDLGINGIMTALDKVRDAMAKSSIILGAHLEGPYLNPSFGSKSTGGEIMADPLEYMPLLETNIIKHMTYAPEVNGTDRLMRDLKAFGIKGSIGHSCASPCEVKRAEADGATIVTHLFDATGASISPTRWGGTFETDFSFATLVCDNFYYEIICDKNGVHVRPELVLLLSRAVGVDKIIGITDACGGESDGGDVNFEDGELMGSKLTMNQVAKNFSALGFSEADVSKITSANPAKALGVFDERGEIAVGKRADFAVLDKNWNIVSVYKS